jgi:putative transposase
LNYFNYFTEIEEGLHDARARPCRKTSFGMRAGSIEESREALGSNETSIRVFRRLAEQKESRIEEGHLMNDHVHMMISLPPKYSVAQVVGYIKGKSAIHLARVYGERKRNIVGQHFWARGYFVSTVGRDERVIREYIRKQEREDERLDQMRLEM